MDEFLKRIQQEKMRGLWDNEYDDRYDSIIWDSKDIDWKFEITPEIKEAQEMMALAIQNISIQIQARQEAHTKLTMHNNYSMPIMRRVGNENEFEFIVICDTCENLQ